MRRRIDLDHHATTPLCAAAREAIVAALGVGGNPSSPHGLGRRARALMEHARGAIAAAIGAEPREVVLTSGGTEAVHLAVRGVSAGQPLARVLLDPGAHPALVAAARDLARERGCAADPLPVGLDGEIDLGALDRALSTDRRRALIAVTWVQHETGAIAPVDALGALATDRGAALVLDGVQALGKLSVAIPPGAAAAAFSAHKIGGPSGAGAAWLRDGDGVALQSGGGQERGLRAGTECLLGAVGFGAAAADIPRRLAAMTAVAARRDAVERALLAVPGVVVNARERARVATACHASVRGAAGPELVAAFDLEGLCVAAGPACSSGRSEPSASVLAMYPEEPWRARDALRVTLGPETTDDDVATFAALASSVIARVRR